MSHHFRVLKKHLFYWVIVTGITASPIATFRRYILHIVFLGMINPRNIYNFGVIWMYNIWSCTKGVYSRLWSWRDCSWTKPHVYGRKVWVVYTMCHWWLMVIHFANWANTANIVLGIFVIEARFMTAPLLYLKCAHEKPHHGDCILSLISRANYGSSDIMYFVQYTEMHCLPGYI